MVLKRIALNTAAVAGPEIETFRNKVQQELLGGFPGPHGTLRRWQHTKVLSGCHWTVLTAPTEPTAADTEQPPRACPQLFPYFVLFNSLKVISKPRVETSNSSNYWVDFLKEFRLLAPRIPSVAHFFPDMFPVTPYSFAFAARLHTGHSFHFPRTAHRSKTMIPELIFRKWLIICPISKGMKEGTKMIFRHVMYQAYTGKWWDIPWGINNYEDLRKWNFPIRDFWLAF